MIADQIVGIPGNEAIPKFNRTIEQVASFQIQNGFQDKMVWRWNAKGCFLVRSTYKFLAHGPVIQRNSTGICKTRSQKE